MFYSSAGIYIFGLVFFFIFGTAKAQSWGVIEGRSRGTTMASSFRCRSRGATLSSTYKNVSAPTTVPSTPRSPIRELNYINDKENGLVFTITFADSDQQHKLPISEIDEGIGRLDDEEEFDDFHYFNERRFSIFPIP